MKPMLVRSDLDDAGLTCEEFRVYGHLCRRADNKNGKAWPSYQSIGDKCFMGECKKNAEAREKKAMRAVKGLISRGLLQKKKRVGKDGRQTSNEYTLLPWSLSQNSDAERQSPEPIQQEDGAARLNGSAPSPLVTQSDQDAWAQVLAPILFGHSNHAALLPAHWRQVHQLAGKLEALGVGGEQVQQWYEKQWKTTWPGNKGDNPRPMQVMNGIGAWLEKERAVPPAPAYVLVAVEDEE